MSVKSLSEVKPQPNQSIIDLLEEKLEDARSGELTGIVMVLTHGGRLGGVGSRWAGTWSAPEAMWAVEIWKRQLVDDALEAAADE